jgi:hypothetical protein
MRVRFVAVATGATLAGARVERSVELPAVVGRAAAADLVLADPSVALEQVRLDADAEGWTVEALAGGDSRLDGRRLVPGNPVPLRAGQPLELGIYQLVLLEQPPAEVAAGAQTAARRLARRLLGCGARPVLRVCNGPAAGWRQPLPAGRTLLLGRGADCDLVLDDRAVSRRHARIRFDGRRVWLSDDGAANGVWLGRRRVRGRVAVAADARIALGAFRLELIWEMSPAGGWSAVWEAPAAPREVRAGSWRELWWLGGAVLIGAGALLQALL